MTAHDELLETTKQVSDAKVGSLCDEAAVDIALPGPTLGKRAGERVAAHQIIGPTDNIAALNSTRSRSQHSIALSMSYPSGKSHDPRIGSGQPWPLRLPSHTLALEKL